MITKFEKPELLTRLEIDQKYDGQYVAVQQTDELFGEGLGYVVAVGEKTEAVFNELLDYIGILLNSNGMGGTVVSGNTIREEDELYVVISNVR